MTNRRPRAPTLDPHGTQQRRKAGEMSDTKNVAAAGPAQVGSVAPEHRRRTGWAGMVVFAGVMLIMLGGFQAIEGLVAIFDPGYYLVTRTGLVVEVDYTSWGWTHLIIGGLAL